MSGKYEFMVDNYLRGCGDYDSERVVAKNSWSIRGSVGRGFSVFDECGDMAINKNFNDIAELVDDSVNRLDAGIKLQNLGTAIMAYGEALEKEARRAGIDNPEVEEDSVEE